MSLPNPNTSTETLARICEELSPLCKASASLFAVELGSKRELHSEALNHASLLRSSQDTFDREQLEDKDIVTEREALQRQFQSFVRSLTAGVMLRTQDLEDARRIQGDFPSIVSDIRTSKKALEVIEDLSRALEVHKRKLNQEPSRVPYWTQQLTQYQHGFRQLSLDRAREKRETREARQTRDQTREQAIKFVRTLDLVTRSLEHEHPALHLDFSSVLLQVQKEV